jgi:hypothetical protein
MTDIDKLIRNALVSVVGACIIGLFVWVWNTNTKLVLMQQSVDRILLDTETRAKFWRRHGWAKTQINTLRTLHDLPIINWHVHMDDDPE